MKYFKRLTLLLLGITLVPLLIPAKNTDTLGSEVNSKSSNVTHASAPSSPNAAHRPTVYTLADAVHAPVAITPVDSLHASHTSTSEIKKSALFTHTSAVKAVPQKIAGKKTTSGKISRKKKVNRPLKKKTPVHVTKEKKRNFRYIKKFRGNISAYTDRESGLTSRDGDYGLTASGYRTRAGCTVAADRSIPFGTILYIEGIGYRTVHDRGGAIRGNKLDVYMPSLKAVNKFGRQHLDVYIIKWGNGKRARHGV